MSENLSNYTAVQTIGTDSLVVANLMNEHRFARMMVIAETMASASLIPEHLLGRKKGGSMEWYSPEEVRANCFLIVNQAFRWGMDPFAVMPETYVVGGKLGYQGKLIAGLVNSLADLEERLNYEFKGTKGTPDFTVIVSGKFRGAKAPVTVEVSVAQAKTDNQMWTKDPEQKLVYTGATKWARRWCPEIILGILTDDDLDSMPMRDATPPHVASNANPYEKALPAPEEKPAAKASAKKEAAKAKETATEKTAEEPTGETPPVEAVVIPSRKVMYDALKVACRDAEVSPPTAEAKFRNAGMIPKGKTLAETTDEQLFAIYQARFVHLPPKNAESENGEQEGGEA